VSDANRNRIFDCRDLAQALESGKYLRREVALWNEGDWTGDGRFDQLDIIAALQTGRFRSMGADDIDQAIDVVLTELGGPS
jgi:hypothetical protein